MILSVIWFIQEVVILYNSVLYPYFVLFYVKEDKKWLTYIKLEENIAACQAVEQTIVKKIRL